uniref:Uncharacterized protein n=1 Tax=Rhizophora mucronata TaxID=61149 RepID=A0A2P2NYP5_RHIMU
MVKPLEFQTLFQQTKRSKQRDQQPQRARISG